MADAEQGSLFEFDDPWKEHWRGMPEFVQEDQTPCQQVLVSFASPGDREKFAALIGMGVPFRIVVEPQEADAYAAVLGRERVLVLDMSYKERYDPCDDLGDSKGKGPGAARNFVWDHSISEGHEFHWVMDDNINGFYRLNWNLKTPCVSPSFWRAMEDFVLRYTNVAMAGPNYFMFAARKTVMPPFVWNTRIYSCNLIRNAAPYRWRGRYNEDTDLSLRMLKDGLCTVQFNAFLQYKMPTQTVAGGNTAEFYDGEGTKAKSQMQVDLHPDVSSLVWKFGRWHHEVDYRPFKRNRPVFVPGFVPPAGVDNYGMILQEKIGEKWVEIRRPGDRTTRYVNLDTPDGIVAKPAASVPPPAPEPAPVPVAIPEVHPLDRGPEPEEPNWDQMNEAPAEEPPAPVVTGPEEPDLFAGAEEVLAPAAGAFCEDLPSEFPDDEPDPGAEMEQRAARTAPAPDPEDQPWEG